ncbi:PepSY domain-containing protein [Pseudogemmobacter sonorensis]|uniref:PepSY domain-containing protein n=1 Tax=Pseudogemmobacter sonorensis TaxID=2989681 RepID=UPI0036C3BA5C
MRILPVIATCALCLSSVQAETGSGQEAGFLPQIGFDDGLDAGTARAAMLRGEILPLDQILAIVRSTFPGEIIEVELELEDGVLVYEFDILGPDGRLFEVEVAAATGTVLKVEEGDGDD